MEAILPYIAAFWASAFFMLMWRTYTHILLLVDMYQNRLIQKHRVLHFFVYTGVCIVIAPFLWKVILDNYTRDKYVNEYVKALNGKKK